MGIKFVQTSDNKYVQYRLMTDDWSVNTDDWAIADEGVSIENQEFIYLKTDIEGKILWGIKIDGSIYYGAGVPPQVKDYIEKKIGNYDDVITFLDNLEEGDETLRELLNDKVNKEDGNGIIPLQYVQEIETQEFVNTLVDKDKQIIIGIRKDGTFYLPTLRVEDIRTHWYGKTWYAYGTSLTNIDREGKYAKYVEKLSGLILHNRGKSGGSIMEGGAIKEAVFDDTDGKETADLITLECWANDSGATFGNITDVGNDSFLGNLSQCIVHLQTVSNATIVVMISTMPAYSLRNPNNRYSPTHIYNGGLSVEMTDKMRQLCEIYGVYFIDPNYALGPSRKTEMYFLDNIHHTELGGLVYARYIWSKLKNIPEFDTTIKNY